MKVLIILCALSALVAGICAGLMARARKRADRLESLARQQERTIARLEEADRIAQEERAHAQEKINVARTGDARTRFDTINAGLATSSARRMHEHQDKSAD